MKAPLEAIIAYLRRDQDENQARLISAWCADHEENASSLNALQDIWDLTEQEPENVLPVASIPKPAVNDIIGEAQGQYPGPTTGISLKALPGAMPPTPLGRRSRFAWRWKTLLAAAGLVGLIAGSAITLLFSTAYLSPESQTEFLIHSLETGFNETATLSMSEGSVIHVAPNTHISFGEDTSSRDIYLEGEAFFAVQADRNQPFVVRSSSGKAKALGTRFNVRTSRPLNYPGFRV